MHSHEWLLCALGWPARLPPACLGPASSPSHAAGASGRKQLSMAVVASEAADALPAAAAPAEIMRSVSFNMQPPVTMTIETPDDEDDRAAPARWPANANKPFPVRTEDDDAESFAQRASREVSDPTDMYRSFTAKAEARARPGSFKRSNTSDLSLSLQKSRHDLAAGRARAEPVAPERP